MRHRHRRDVVAEIFREGHADNMPHGHIHSQARYAPSAINLAGRLGDNMPMGKHRHFIKEWRKHRGLTQEQFAERLGITQGQLSKLENGKRDYDQAFLEHAADVLNCAPADLLIRDPSKEDAMWSLWDTLAPTERVQAVKVIQAIKGTGTDG